MTQTTFNKISKVTKLKLQQICDKSIIVTISNYDKTQNVKKKLNYEENKKIRQVQYMTKLMICTQGSLF